MVSSPHLCVGHPQEFALEVALKHISPLSFAPGNIYNKNKVTGVPHNRVKSAP